MAIRIIRQEGDEILKKKSRVVEVIDEKIQELVKDMIETMHKYDGIYVLINPEILETKGSREVEEGCLSFPNKFAKVVRPEKVKAKALNEKGEEIIIKAEGLLAQAICHEVDHLNGEVFIDKMIPGTLEIVKPEDK